jgi:hypothetical protein
MPGLHVEFDESSIGAPSENDDSRPPPVAAPRTPLMRRSKSSSPALVQKPGTFSLLVSAMRRRSVKHDDAEAGKLRFSFGNFKSASSRDADEFHQLLAIRIIERHYTRHVRVHPGQLFLDDERSEQAEWGKLTFAGQQRGGSHGNAGGKGTQSYYMRVSNTSEPGRVARCIAKYWHVHKPSVIISITGGARSLQVSAWQRKAFCEGLFAASKATGAIIFTGGTSTGVMALVGDAIGSGHGIPIIGFAPWRKVSSSSLLCGNHGECEPRKYPYGSEAQATDGGASLEPRHTHFVLVDSGPSGGWGDEIPLRDAVQRLLESWFKVPGVLLVLQGGVNTLRTIVEAIITSATPVILVCDSGGAADAVAGYHSGWSATEGTSTFDLASFESGPGFEKGPKWVDYEEQLKEICEAGEALGLLFPIRLSGQDADSIDSAILRAIVRKQRAAQNAEAAVQHRQNASRIYSRMDAFRQGMRPRGPNARCRMRSHRTPIGCCGASCCHHAALRLWMVTAEDGDACRPARQGA